jgi:hypothetical protein
MSYPLCLVPRSIDRKIDFYPFYSLKYKKKSELKNRSFDLMPISLFLFKTHDWLNTLAAAATPAPGVKFS